MVDDIRERIVGFINEPAYTLMRPKDVAHLFGVTKEDRAEFNSIIDSLVEDGVLLLTKTGKLTTYEKSGQFVGKFVANRRGFGFIEKTDMDGKRIPHAKDLFIPPDEKGGALNGDIVVAQITKGETESRRAEGSIVKVLKRGMTDIVGTYQANDKFGFVISDNRLMDKDIFIAERNINGAEDGDKVVCKINIWPEGDNNPEGKITEIIGKKGERYVEIDSIVRLHGLRDEFPEKVIDSFDAVPDSVSEADMEGRLDLRAETIFTIDGDDSKDFDDAVSIKKLNDTTYELGVHIADVTHYVREGAPLDKEAKTRGTSIYLVDKVIPMLPQKLSNGICSLNPNVDRLTLSCIMQINQKGEVVSHKIVKSVIQSKHRMTYHIVSEMLENEDDEYIKEYNDIYEDLKLGRELAEILMRKRDKRGAINFDFDESMIKLDEKGIPVAIEPYERRISNKMIEEFMLAANETVAEHYFWMEAPFVYRIHEKPDPEKMMMLARLVNNFGIHMQANNGDVHPKELQKVLKKASEGVEGQFIAPIMLRSLKQARYSPLCDGHFGLAAKYYCHFTSPIRRYPDLQIHRIIKDDLDGKLDRARIKHYEQIVYPVSEISSEMERVAELAERDVDDYYKAVFMKDKVGEVFEGRISNITAFGMFVELDNSVEGLIKISSIDDDYYEFFENSFSLVGVKTKKTFRIGQRLKVKIANVDVDYKEIDFELA